MQPIVQIFGNIDLYALGLISKIPIITETKRFGGNKLFTDEIEIECKNYTNILSVDYFKSIFSGMRWKYGSCKIWDNNNIQRWNGVIRNIKLNHNNKSVKIISANSLSKYFSRNINYESSAWETPAQAFKNICDSVGFTYYDNNALNTSDSVYAENGCYIKCYFNSGDDITLQQAIEKIAEICGADIYGHDDLIYFKVFRIYSGGASYTITTDDMVKVPELDFLEDQLINDYNIKYVGCNDTATKDINNGNIGLISRQDNSNGVHDMAEIDGQAGNEIEIKDLPSAVFIGEQGIRKSHMGLSGIYPSPLKRNNFSVGSKFNKYIDINTYFKMDFIDESWTEKVFDPIEIKINSDAETIDISAVEVES